MPKKETKDHFYNHFSSRKLPQHCLESLHNQNLFLHLYDFFLFLMIIKNTLKLIPKLHDCKILCQLLQEDLQEFNQFLLKIFLSFLI